MIRSDLRRRIAPGVQGYTGIQGYTMAQLLIAGAVLLILSAVALVRPDDPHTDTMTVARELAGWLEAVQRRAQLLAGEGCTVTLQTSDDSLLAEGRVLARVSPASCALGQATVPDFSFSQPRFQQRLAAGSASFTYTPRGTISATSDTELAIRRGEAPMIACVRISAILGLVNIAAEAIAPGAEADTTRCREQSYDALSL